MSAISTSAAGMGGAAFRVGDALNRTFSVFVAGFGKFVVLAAIPLAPVLLIDLVAIPASENTQQGLNGLASLVQFVLGSLATGTCLFGAYQIMRGRPFTISESFTVASGRLATLLGATLLVGLLTALAFLALIVPGVMLMIAWTVVLPAVVVERLGVRAAMRRSRALTSGNRWAIFGLIILAAIITGIAVGIATGIVAVIAAVSTGLGSFLAVITVICVFAGTVVAQAFSAVLSAVIYHDLRVAKEGVDVEKLADVFA
jgi:hypothetical protein